MTGNTDKRFDNSERYRDLGCAIAYYRKRKGLTQEQLRSGSASAGSIWGPLKRPIW